MENTYAEDGKLITFGRAAELIAQADPCLTVPEVLEALKRGIFAGVFDVATWAETPAIETPLLMEADVPRAELAKHHGVLKTRAKQLFGVNREGVTMLLLRENGAPGNRRLLNRWFRRWLLQVEVYDHLERTPLRDYPEVGRSMIAEIRIARGRLREWLAEHHFPALSCLGAPEHPPEPPAKRELPLPQEEDAGKSLGRPELPGWQDVRDYIVDAHAADPARPFKVLAYEARAYALRLYGEVDVPSEATILRRMKEILNN